MNIGRNWKIESDSMNVTVYKKSYPRKKKDGTKTKGGWYPEAYFGTVAGALKWLVNQEINETGLADLKTVAGKIDKVERMINKALEEKK